MKNTKSSKFNLLVVRLVIGCLIFSGFLTSNGSGWAQVFSPDRNFKIALTAFEEGNFNAARVHLQEILNKDPLGDFAHSSQYYLSLSYYYEGEYKSALFSLMTLNRDYPASSYIARSQFWIGECHYYLNEYQKAKDSHFAFIRNYPDNNRVPNARYTIGYIYMTEKRFDEAISEFSIVVKKYPQEKIAADAALQLGIAYFNTKEFSLARSQFKDLILTYSKSKLISDAQYWIGRTYYGEDKFVEAEREFRLMAETYPGEELTPDAIFYQGLSYYRLKNLDLSIEKLKIIEEKYPLYKNYPQTIFRLGQLYQEKNDLQGAADKYKLIIEKYPNSAVFHHALELLGDSYQKLKKTDEAMQIYNKIIDESKEPELLQVVLQKKAAIYFIDNRFDEAAQTYDKFVQQFPEHTKAAEAIFMQAQSLFKMQKYSESDKKLDHIILQFPNSDLKVDAYFLKGEISYYIGKYELALQSYRKVTRFYRQHKRYGESLLGIGWSYFELKQYANAAETFRQLLQDVKDSEEILVRAKVALGRCLYNIKDFNGAEKLFEEVIHKYAKYHDDAEEAYFQLAWISYRKKEYTPAIKKFNDYLNKYPAGKRATASQYFGGWSYYQIKDYPNAALLFEKIWKAADDKDFFKEKSLLDLIKVNHALKNCAKVLEHIEQFEKVYAGSNSLEESYYLMSQCYLEAEKEDKVNEAIHKMILAAKTSSYLPEMLRNLAEFYKRKGRIDEAAKTIARIKDFSQTSDDKWSAEFLTARLYYDNNKNAEAEKVLYNILELKQEDVVPFRIRALVMLNEAAFAQKQFAKGLADLEKYEKTFQGKDHENDRKELIIWRARLQLEMNQAVSAVKLLAEMLKDPSYQLLARFYSGVGYYQLKDYSKSFDFFKQVSQKTDSVMAGPAHYYMGEIFFAQNKIDLAINEYTKLEYQYSDNSEYLKKSLLRLIEVYKNQNNNKYIEMYQAKYKKLFPNN